MSADCLWTKLGRATPDQAWFFYRGFAGHAACATSSRMSIPTTLALIAGFLLAGLFCGWRGARPPDLIRGPRMIPWRVLMVASATGVLIFVVHLVNLLGVETGRR